MDYSLGGVSSGFVRKRAKGELKKHGGNFVRMWPEWIPVETAFNLELEWLCLQETTHLEALSSLYPEVNIIVWKTGVILPPVEYLVSSLCLPPKSHWIWDDPALEFVFSSMKIPGSNGI
jgi:hypothetical protein